jgi:hypothetical protein
MSMFQNLQRALSARYLKQQLNHNFVIFRKMGGGYPKHQQISEITLSGASQLSGLPRVIVALTRWDMALEAFRHNPTDGSLDRVREPNVRTCGSSHTEQDYCCNDPVISRVKLTCLR